MNAAATFFLVMGWGIILLGVVMSLTKIMKMNK